MRAYSTRFDASLLSCAVARAVVAEAAALEHMAATVKSLAAARAAHDRTWKEDGHRSAEEALARETGSTLAGAREALTLGRHLGEQPEVAAAARRGDLSPTQASAIADAVAADPDSAGRLVDAATAGGSVADLKDQCAAVKAAADADLEARRTTIRRRRSLRAWTDQGGTWHLVAAGNPEDGAQVMAALAPLADQCFHEARLSGHRERPDAYHFDALVQLAIDSTSHPAALTPPTSDRHAVEVGSVAGPQSDATRASDDGGPPGTDPLATSRSTTKSKRAKTTAVRTKQRGRRGAPVKLLLRVDLDAFLRGFPTRGETCDLVGYGPLSMSAVHDILNEGDPFVAAILARGRQLVGVAHLGRQPTAHQRSALEWIHPTCAAQGCPSSARLQIDHRVDWAQTHITLLDWLDALCAHHHALKTRRNWALVNGTGKRPFVAPSDSRHPRHDRSAA